MSSKLSFFKRSSVAARALRQVLKEEKRLEAERRGDMGLRYQIWKDGKAGEQTWVKKPAEEK
ncbi:hypothetical protein BT69DRAFT_1356300 [Atractiella rhizophila]|nr:hypothetical protein BT69DRAFT_1356300 [Atractiella rhizophila]